MDPTPPDAYAGAQRRDGEVSTGTTLMAVRYAGGVHIHVTKNTEDEHKQQENHRLQKDKERERETAKRTGQVGCLFERTTRNRTAAKPVKVTIPSHG